MLHRFPKGLAGEKVHQKRLPQGAPPWVETVRLHFPRWNRTADELCVTELGSVIWAVQMSTVEFHPWNSRREDPEKPDEWRIDLDPGPLSDYAQVRRVAKVTHEVLDELGAVGFPKTSGGKGLHVYVRIRPDHGHKAVRRAALAFAREVERRAPDDVTTAWWRKDRDPHHLFVDYNQNARDHTIAAAYSVRGFADARVSAPVRWEEVDDCRPARLHDVLHARAVRRARRPARGHRRRRLRHRAAAGVGRPRRAGRRGDARRARRVVRTPLRKAEPEGMDALVEGFDSRTVAGYRRWTGVPSTALVSPTALEPADLRAAHEEHLVRVGVTASPIDTSAYCDMRNVAHEVPWLGTRRVNRGSRALQMGACVIAVVAGCVVGIVTNSGWLGCVGGLVLLIVLLPVSVRLGWVLRKQPRLRAPYPLPTRA